MLLTIASRDYLESTNGITKQMGEYERLTGKMWEPYNEELGYTDAREWHEALLNAIADARKRQDQNQQN